MENYRSDIIRLIHLSLTGAISEEQRKQLEEWLSESAEHRLFLEEIRKEANFSHEFELFQTVDVHRGWERFTRSIDVAPCRTGRMRRLSRLARYAAVLLLPLAVALAVWLLPRPTTRMETVSAVGTREVTLTTATAVLTLCHRDSAEIQLGDSLKAVQQAQSLHYAQGKRVASGALHYNTLDVPRGGEFRVVLSDGTVVHVNSGSRLTYPEVFAADQRRVVLSGEAYFEVAKDADRPFYVETEEVKIEVYGTQFNVNTLKEQTVQTVLVKGKIGISPRQGGMQQVMMPGQLASYDRRKQAITLKNVDVKPYVAWKDGVFYFEDQSLEEILSTLSLWYDVEVFYQNQGMKDLHFTGHLRRYEEITTILEAITEAIGVKFSLEKNVVIVSK